MPDLDTLKHRKTAKQARIKRKSRGSRAWRRIKHALKRVNVAIRRKKRKAAESAPTVMYDDVTISSLPAEPGAAYAGYVDGRYANIENIKAHFPHAKTLSIAVASHTDAECLDVESGDATNADASAWVKRQHARGLARPVLYTSISNAASLLFTLANAGIERQSVRLWTAHYTGRAHICDRTCGYSAVKADATQWTDHSHNRSLDESLCAHDFF